MLFLCTRIQTNKTQHNYWDFKIEIFTDNSQYYLNYYSILIILTYLVNSNVIDLANFLDKRVQVLQFKMSNEISKKSLAGVHSY